MEATLSSKGQATIPKHIRDSLGLKPGSKLEFTVNDAGEIVLRPTTTPTETMQQRLDRAVGILKEPWPGGTDAFMALMRGDD